MQTIDGIKLCKKGYLELERPPKVTTVSGGKQIVEWGEGGLDTVYFRCYVGSKNEFSSVRTIIDKHPPTFVATPRRPTGGGYDMNQSNGSDTGTFVDLEDSDQAGEGAEVAGTLGRISYNSALGCFDIQNQITAVLLEDCDPASIPTPDVDNVDNLTSTQMYDANNPSYQGDFTTCEAMPLSVEKGNPFVYGPNFIKCSDGTTVEKIIATNRSPKEFKKGQRVICHYIDNEWIMQEIGQPTPREPTPTAVGRWSFAKFIANINQHFLPDRMDYYGTYQQGEGVEDTRIDISNMYLPMRTDSLEEALVWQFWQKNGENYPWMQQTIEELLDGRQKGDWGDDPNNWKLNRGIIQTSIFDQYKLADNTQALYTKTNPGGALEVPYPETAPLFFGPLFLEGYKKRIIPDETTPQYQKSSNVLSYELGVPGIDSSPTSIDFESTGDAGGDLSAIRSIHLPAEVGINGPYQSLSSPVESYHVMADGINRGDYSFLAKKQHYNYKFWRDADGDIQSFGLQPVNPAKVQFMGLSMQFACADDIYAITDNMTTLNRGLAFRSDALNIVAQNTVTDDEVGYSKVVAGLGDALTRGSPDVQTGPPAPGRRQRYDVGGLGFAFFEAGNTAAGGDQLCPKYDHYVDVRTGEGRNALRLLSPSQLWIGSDNDNDDNAAGELVGIITGRNKILRDGGGVVKITSVFNFGQGSRRTVSGFDAEFQWGGLSNFSISPAGTNTTSGSTWGDSEDTPQSFGTMNLFLKVYDYWPEDQTVFIAPYFTVLHFNPGEINTPAETQTTYFLKQKDKDTGNLYIDYSVEAGEDSFNEHGKAVAVEIDVLTHTTDFRVPTYGDNPGSLFGEVVVESITKDGEEVGGLIDIGEKSILRPEKYWNVDTSRRGVMLTGSNFFDDEFGTYGGFIYGKKVIGLSKGFTSEGLTYEISDNGTGFAKGEKYPVGNKGAVIEVKAVNDDGGITSFDFAESTDDQNLVNNKRTYKQRGEGYLPSDLPFNAVIPAPDGGTACQILFKKGTGYIKYEYDTAPRAHLGNGNGKKLNPAGANEGNVQLSGGETYSIQLPDNSSYSPYPGQYEFFYYFHNDISFVTENNNSYFDINNNIQTIGIDIV